LKFRYNDIVITWSAQSTVVSDITTISHGGDVCRAPRTPTSQSLGRTSASPVPDIHRQTERVLPTVPTAKVHFIMC